jgi:hypothetical protein
MTPPVIARSRPFLPWGLDLGLLIPSGGDARVLADHAGLLPDAQIT